ncbi:glycine--tRNA ligase subunit beta [Desulfoprunum benzoelyticum]|uniref:Glycine--tRNA ligase beta subunit n=1 Tax=Desulfoprunum benzoelyticum TaxID=1506996 RepID=A0A840UM98_9BACT|nr:glycine--tRNA ligase subunit beta [Desulfoprunum benzoelyticum]MBB5346735.1 glycyl-tRNA synthetase beta chain [Desulfoprunum benzoelyticum]MBM9529023.1 glycine--tRNA ligase subunit beta [Desulfoprunum benzoelyticum]
MRDLLFEIGTEELPAGFIEPALTQLRDNFVRKAQALNLAHGEVLVKGTPRRLALIVLGLVERQQDSREELLGPSKAAAFDRDGRPTRAVEGFARSKGVTVNDLQVVETAKGEYLMLVREVAGRPTAELLPELLLQLIIEMTFAKSMRWGSNIHPFARPIQWLTALFGSEVITVQHEGIVSSAQSRGHRFMAHVPFTVTGAATYVEQLRDHHVLVDPFERRQAVVQEIEKAVQTFAGAGDARVAVDEELVDTVTNLVEYPFGICGTFEDKFLQVPAEVLITSMREHQKYFPVVDGAGRLLPGFVAVNNTRVDNPDVSRKGHQRVLRARLSDALFFFNTDRETTLEARRDQLGGIVFQARLGTMREKTERVVKLTRMLCEILRPELTISACRAASLCKADLLTSMVGEFPSLQGVMGRAYAQRDGEPEAVAMAIQEHYMPKRAGAELPASDVGAILGLADRIDTIAGCFGIGQVPTGTADPFGLRRLSLAVLNLIAGKGYRLSLSEVVHKALALYGDKVDAGAATVKAVMAFIEGRFVNDCAAKGMDVEAVEAVVSVGFDDVIDSLERIEAFRRIRSEDAFAVLAAAYKRIRNIVKDNGDTRVESSLLQAEAEKELHVAYLQVREKVETRLAERDYLGALKDLLQLKQPVDRFFDDVMVMTDDLDIRRNRLNLLTAIGELILRIGDISKMQEG